MIFTKLETALFSAGLGVAVLGRMATELEELLPSPTEAEIERAFAEVTERLGIAAELAAASGKRVALRMVVTIASTLSQPVVRESGVMRLPQTIRGLFDLAPKSPPTDGSGSKRES